VYVYNSRKVCANWNDHMRLIRELLKSKIRIQEFIYIHL